MVVDPRPPQFCRAETAGLSRMHVSFRLVLHVFANAWCKRHRLKREYSDCLGTSGLIIWHRNPAETWLASLGPTANFHAVFLRFPGPARMTGPSLQDTGPNPAGFLPTHAEKVQMLLSDSEILRDGTDGTNRKQPCSV